MLAKGVEQQLFCFMFFYVSLDIFHFLPRGAIAGAHAAAP